jgi:2-dehydro-3-deoxyglucarate aldolase
VTEVDFNPLRTRLRQGEACIGAWLMSGSPIHAEAMASLGFDWLCVDLEHGSTDISDIEAVFVAAERHGAAPMARINALDGDLARRLLDLGAMGIIVATSESARDFSDFAGSCLYAPAGRRGVGLSRCNLWGDRFEGYKRDFQPILAPMIETRLGVDEAGALAALPMVDAMFMGPYDLSSDLGCAGEFDNPVFTDAVATVRKACEDHAVAPGYHQVICSDSALQARIDEGFKLVAYGTDILSMRQALSGVRTIKDKQI